jgi:glycosyltransferase involved in cell wall biosynthesis
MKIGMILDSQFPPDIRVENEAKSLSKNGYDVFILSLSHSHEFKGDDTWEGIRILRIPLAKKLAKKGRGSINTVLDVYTPYWAGKIQKFINDHQLDVLHVHDLFMLGAAFRGRRTTSIPIIADLHENYVEGLKHYRFANSFPGNMLISINKWSKTELEWCRKADHLITVIDEAVDRYVSLGIGRKKIHVVANYVHIDDFLNVPDIKEIIDRIGSHFSATYIGGFDTHRGLENTLLATAIIAQQIPQFKLILVGHGANFASLKDLTAQLNITENVSFEGYQHPDTIPSYIKGSSICLIPHLKTEHTDNTIPHKLFHYMLLGKPVIASNCAPLERIIKSENCGLIYLENNPEDLADKIIKAYNNREMLQDFGRNGRDAVHKKYNWHNAEAELLNLYDNL